MTWPLRPIAGAFVVLVVAGAWPADAQAQKADAATLFDVLRLAEFVALMRDEGLDSAGETGDGLFGGRAPAEWMEAVDAAYDTARMEREVMAALEEASTGIDLDPIVAFFGTAPGAEFIELELAARRSLLDDDVEQMAREAAAVAMAEQSPLFAQIERFVTANDLVEANVVATMNSSYAFSLGLMDGGGLPVDVTEDDILADIWGQEADFRATTQDWIYSFLLLAYGPAAPEDLETYIAFSETEAGQTANRIVFGAFDGMFEGISISLGRTAARLLTSEEL
jgi:hypothetical protein